jgi:hypothetical protein
MATLDLTLNSFEVPALSEYIPPFGHKKQKGGLSTQEVNNNIMMPFLNMRPTIVTENSVTTRIEYDAKLVFFANLQNAVNLDLEKASYIGCEILIYNLSAHACTVNKNTWNYTVPAGGYIKLKWNGSAWSQGVSSAVQAAIRDAVADRYSTTETMTSNTWIDGKPIYRRVLVTTTAFTLTESWINIVTYCGNPTLDMRDLISTSNTLETGAYMKKNGPNSIIWARQGSSISVPVGTAFIIEYTKTTD